MTDKLLRKYLAFCSFVGLKYKGYQEQKFQNTFHKTVQQTLEVFLIFLTLLLNSIKFKSKSILKEALNRITKAQTKISSCSRTDAGVNAFRLPFHFVISFPDNDVKHKKFIA